MATIYTERMSVPRRNPTADHAIAHADSDHRSVRATVGVRYQGERVRRGKEPLLVTLAEWIRAKNGVTVDRLDT